MERCTRQFANTTRVLSATLSIPVLPMQINEYNTPIRAPAIALQK
jgi:hypothetical protein